ncbi:SHOCT domain-containing protein [Patescibacteria group bacterium]|nr:SHOCT domain-containing protein [Patescibacteria group bacterium]
MKKLLFGLSTLSILGFVFFSSVSAQGMMNWGNTSSATPSSVISTAQDEAKGKQIWEQLQSKQVTCESLKDDDFEALGEYFMGQSVGNIERHAAMNQMMQNMMGQNREEQMHISLGKRSSGCDTNASFPSGYGLPMMWRMMGGGGNPMMGYGSWNNMMGSWGGFGVAAWLTMILFWGLLILGVIALIRYLLRSGQDRNNKTPSDILKERYAKGEINKREFEQMKNDLG